MGNLPHLDADRPFLTDGGLETTLIFHRGLDLPAFAAFTLLRDDRGTDELRAYFAPYLDLARERRTGFVLDTATWRANPDWAAELGYAPDDLDAANRRAVALAEELRDAHPDTPIVLNGVVGPRDDGYRPKATMTATEAERYHGRQVATFADTVADMVSAITMTYADEAIGIVNAGRAQGLPVAAAYFMINCAHPTHFAHVLDDDGAWRERVRGLRANASSKSHAELDEAEELDEGDPQDLGARHRDLKPRLPNVAVLGGCCGTDHRHVAAVGDAWTA